MCKVFMINDMSEINESDLTKLIEVIEKNITRTEVDGFGYAFQGKSGVYGERTTEVKDFYVSTFDFNPEWLESNDETFGEYSKPTGSGIFHGRTSTNTISLSNTHPISKNDWHLIHNGVVDNEGMDYKMETSCDSEHIIQYLSTEGIESVEKFVSGYYAFSALSPEGKLIVCRDSSATLFSAWCETINSIIFGTTLNLIDDIAVELDWTLTKIRAVKDDTYLEFIGNELQFSKTIHPIGFSYEQSSLMGTSLSYLGDNEYSKKWKEGNSVITGDFDKVEKFKNGVDFDSEDYYRYIEEIHTLDGTYQIYDYFGRSISHIEFKSYRADEMLECRVLRADGSEVSPYYDSRDTKLAS